MTVQQIQSFTVKCNTYPSKPPSPLNRLKTWASNVGSQAPNSSGVSPFPNPLPRKQLPMHLSFTGRGKGVLTILQQGLVPFLLNSPRPRSQVLQWQCRPRILPSRQGLPIYQWLLGLMWPPHSCPLSQDGSAPSC